MFDQNQPAQSAQVVPEPITTSDSAAASTTDAATYNTTPVTPEPVTETTASTSSEMPVASETQTVAEPAAETTVPETPAADDNLLTIKKDALQNLTPLLSQLEQTPEEKFRTTMMLIQASDDKSLIQSAYDAAKDIEDEKVRAQALLDIVNEINYFTQEKEDK
jgi:hypothetical protein